MVNGAKKSCLNKRQINDVWGQKKMKYIFRVFILVLMMVILLVGISLIKHKEEVKKEIVQHVFSKKVEQYRPLVSKYAKEHGVEEHIDVLLAMMMQESGGRGNDPMQSSESLCGKTGCIDDPELSIKQGVAYFSETLAASEGNVELAVQSYNFGIGFVHYVKEKEKFDHDITIQYSQEMYKKAENPAIYTCLREEAKQYDACYGDIYYSRDVMEYKNKFAIK